MLQLQELDKELVRFLSLMLPAFGSLLVIAIQQPKRIVLIAVFINFIWCFSTVFVLNQIALELNWWSYSAQTLTLDLVPIDILLGWSLLWAGVLYPLMRKLNVLFLVSVVFVIDIVVMPSFTQLFELGNYWLIGEAVGILFCLVPGFYLAKSTETDSNVELRSFLLAIAACGILLYIIPIAILELSQKSWREAFALSSFEKNIYFNLLLILALIGFSANYEFSKIGRGTPLPFYPPKKIVKTGIYAYLANPMQVILLLTFTILSIAYQSYAMTGGIAMTLAYCLGIVRLWNKENIAKQFPQSWSRYKENVNNWWPRFTPYVPQSAQLYFSAECEICQSTKAFFAERKLHNLDLLNADSYPGECISKSSYIHPDGFEETGVKAIARGLEHINIFFAFYAWLMRLPGIAHFLQFLLDTLAIKSKPIYPQNNTAK